MQPVLGAWAVAGHVFAVFGYGAMLVVALTLGAGGTLLGASRARLEFGAVVASLGAAVAGAFVGGVALAALVDLLRGAPGPWQPGLVFYGGLAGGALGLFGMARALGLPGATLLDVAAVPSALAHAAGRLGCLLGGCCYGAAGGPPWAVVYTHPLAPASALGAVPRHPVQAYEALGLLALGLLLATFGRVRGGRLQRLAPGGRFACYVAGYAVLRFGLEYLRADPERGELVAGLSTSQAIALTTLAGSAVVLRRTLRRRVAAGFVSQSGPRYTRRVRSLPSLAPLALAGACALAAAAVRADGGGGAPPTASGPTASAPAAAHHRLRGPSRVRIAAGSFSMGSQPRDLGAAVALCARSGGQNGGQIGGATPACRTDLFEDELPRRRVHLSAYAIDRTEVSHRAYRRCVSAGACNPSELSASDQRLGAPDMPVASIDHSQAAAYCAFVGGRLPTEAEWERAARGGTHRRFPWGSAFSSRLANYGSPEGLPDPADGYRFAAPVQAFPDGRSVHGLLNMAGNVWEWTADYYGADYYATATRVDPPGPPGPSGQPGEGGRVIRGGSWRSPPHTLRTTQRAALTPDATRPDVGFRCAY